MIEESLRDRSVLSRLTVIETVSRQLEGESEGIYILRHILSKPKTSYLLVPNQRFGKNVSICLFKSCENRPFCTERQRLSPYNGSRAQATTFLHTSPISRLVDALSKIAEAIMAAAQAIAHRTIVVNRGLIRRRHWNSPFGNQPRFNNDYDQYAIIRSLSA